MQSREDIIVAPATLSGGAIAIVRVSGAGSIELADGIFRSKRGGTLSEAKGYTLHYGDIVDNKEVIDDVMLSLFRAPHSYTSEDGVEISCHGSSYIVSRIIELITSRGARMATAGEFTVRAFLSGRIDLSQAEAVSDMIASSNAATHRLASTQIRGGYSERLNTMRGELLRLAALLELELDFSEEDVEFASRDELRSVMERLQSEIERLIESFKVGNAIKQGVAVAIVGAPNAGKSTLLNRILGEERAMVSTIAGTTRDSIEEVITLGGVSFRFIDTAGIHSTEDELERMGIERTYGAMESAQVVIQLVDIADSESFERVEVRDDQQLIVVINKSDLRRDAAICEDALYISAKDGYGVDQLIERLCSSVDLEAVFSGDIVVSSSRHHAHLRDANESLALAIESLNNKETTDLLSDNLRHTLHHIGSITGEITTDEILAHIFSSFCIGK